MNIKTMDGDTRSVTSSGQGNLNTVLGTVGALGTLTGGGSLLGGVGFNRYMQPYDHLDGHYLTRHEADLMQQLIQKDLTISRKESENALLKSEKYTDEKLVEVYTQLRKVDKEQDAKMAQMRQDYDRDRRDQCAWNATATASMSTMAAQIQALNSVTKVFIPSSNICRSGSNCCQDD